MLSLLLATCTIGGALGSITKIKSAEDFIEFAASVNAGNDYMNTIVYLAADIEFTDELSKQFTPVGNDWEKPFKGSFDGMGHTISNLKVNTSGESAGLFGFSEGTAIQNVVVDDSCSFESVRGNGTSAYVSPLIGRSTDSLIVSSCVNIAPVTFSGNTELAYVGGLIGSFSGTSIRITNSANYGALSHPGRSIRDTFMGGILGNIEYSERIDIVSTLNAGEISFTGSTTGVLQIGGFSGDIFFSGGFCSISYFMSYGTITNRSATEPAYQRIGAICGHPVGASIDNSYWLPNNQLDAFGSEYNTTLSSTYQVPECYEAVEKLNIGLNVAGWLHNRNNATITFKINEYKGFILKSEVILLLDLEPSERRIFDGWYKDELFTERQTTSYIDADTTLYALFCGIGYTVTYDVNGGDEMQEKEATVPCNGTYVALPTPTRAEATFLGWYTEREGGVQAKSGERVAILDSHTLYARWNVTKYTVTFDFGNGTTIAKDYAYNEAIEYPAVTVMKPKHSFNGWDSDLELMPARSITITALWEPIYYTVTFDFGDGLNPVYKTYMEGDAIEYPKDQKSGDLVLARWDPYYETMPAENFTTKAVWAQEESVVTFVLPNRPAVNKTFKHSEKVAYPGELEVEGMVFEGWFLDSAFKEPFVGPYVEKDCTLYGKYVEDAEDPEDHSEDAASFLYAMPALLYAVLFAF